MNKLLASFPLSATYFLVDGSLRVELSWVWALFLLQLHWYSFYWTFESSIKLCTNDFVFFAIYAMSVIYDLNLQMENIGSYISFK